MEEVHLTLVLLRAVTTKPQMTHRCHLSTPTLSVLPDPQAASPGSDCSTVIGSMYLPIQGRVSG